MHEIDATSPLAGYDAERFEEVDARLFLSIEARDNAIGALVHDMRVYSATDVLFGMHYGDAVTVDEQKRPVADLTRLSLVEPDRPRRSVSLRSLGRIFDRVVALHVEAETCRTRAACAPARAR